MVGAGVGPRAVGRVLGVSKAFMTRMGEGPFPTKMDPEQDWTIQEKGKELSVTTRRPRRCGWFDGVALHYARRVNGLDELSLTRLDVVDGLDEVPIGGLATGRTAPPEEFRDAGALRARVSDPAGLEPADRGP